MDYSFQVFCRTLETHIWTLQDNIIVRKTKQDYTINLTIQARKSNMLVLFFYQFNIMS